jgi:predicted DNA-binding protein
MLENVNLENIKQIHSVYFKLATAQRIKEETKLTDKSKSEIVQEAVDEYFAGRDSPGEETA